MMLCKVRRLAQMIYLSDGVKDLLHYCIDPPLNLVVVLLVLLPVRAAVILLMHLQRLVMAVFNGSQEIK